MDKAPDAYRTISEVAEDLDLPQHVLRFWETRFAQIKPLKRGGGRRYYRPDDVELLKGIRHLLYKEGYTIKGVQRILKEQGIRSVQAFAREIEPEAWQLPREEMVSHPPHAAEAGAAPHVVSASPGLPVFPSPPAPPVAPRDIQEPVASAANETIVPEFQPIEVPEPLRQIVPQPMAPPAQQPMIHRGHVSMFRGGLRQRDTTSESGAMTDYVNDLRDRVVQHTRYEAVEAQPAQSRDKLVQALEDLVACRATIDRLLARRSDRQSP